MSEFVFFLTIGLVLGTVLLIFAMKYVAVVQAARARAAEELGLRGLAERSVKLQADTTATLATIQTSLGELRTRLTSIEKMLKDVG